MKPFTAIEKRRIINELKKKTHKRDYALFVIATEQGIRGTDLLKLQIKHLVNLDLKERYIFKEGKTNKDNFIFMNEKTHEALHAYLESLNLYDPEEYLFKSRKGDNAITLQQLGRLVKDWCRFAKVKDHSQYGVRSLRKTFGRLAFESSTNPRILSLLKERFNHSSESMTVKYLDITTEDMEALFN
ncbi:tyrosine-type recombinase/integrase [Desulfobacter vibrioformis]|uniref:tyrosine-type recombinase/integrase n=1 Tax=Desulfobacter vibrioformis TaxID=34031 RepID=UPI00068D7DEB|nr:tyrosine-type recombinase/integrase [Desulfobacter vibrioformis]